MGALKTKKEELNIREDWDTVCNKKEDKHSRSFPLTHESLASFKFSSEVI
jgi:hypothetical protein